MEYAELLLSGSSPKIRKAAKSIVSKSETGYCVELMQALDSVMEKPRGYTTMRAVVHAIRTSSCLDALPKLRELLEWDHPATVLYKDLGYAIAQMEGISADNLDFFYQSLESGNRLQICGVCGALMTEEVIPRQQDRLKIIEAVRDDSYKEGQITSPRTYIAALAYLWPKEDTETFLEHCIETGAKTIREIASDSIQGKKTRYILI